MANEPERLEVPTEAENKNWETSHYFAAFARPGGRCKYRPKSEIDPGKHEKTYQESKITSTSFPAGWSHGTVVNSNDSITCPPWVQAPNRPSPRSKDWLEIRLSGNEVSLESLYRPACLRRTLRYIEEDYSHDWYLEMQLILELLKYFDKHWALN